MTAYDPRMFREVAGLCLLGAATLLACNPTDQPVVDDACATGLARAGGENDGLDMYPGRACNDCHQREGGPAYAFAGTVFPAVDDPDDCVGTGGAVVTLTDASGKSWELTTRADSGNFTLDSAALVYPVTASVTFEGRTVTKEEPLTAADGGDCNGCHTVSGLMGAEGRIYAP